MLSLKVSHTCPIRRPSATSALPIRVMTEPSIRRLTITWPKDLIAGCCTSIFLQLTPLRVKAGVVSLDPQGQRPAYGAAVGEGDNGAA